MPANELKANPTIQLPEHIEYSCVRAAEGKIIFDDEILLTRANITKDFMSTLLKYTDGADYWCGHINTLSSLIKAAEKYSTTNKEGDQARYNLRCALQVIDERLCSNEIGYDIDAGHYDHTVYALVQLHKSKAKNAQAYIEKLEAFAHALKLRVDHRVTSLVAPYEYELNDLISASQNASSNPDDYPLTKVITPPPVVQPPLECLITPTNNTDYMCFLPGTRTPAQIVTVNSIAHSTVGLRIAATLTGTGLLLAVIALTFKPTLFNPLLRKGKSLFDNISSGKFGLFSNQVAYAPVSSEESNLERVQRRGYGV